MPNRLAWGLLLPLLTLPAMPAWAQASAELPSTLTAIPPPPAPIDAARAICDTHWVTLPDGTSRIDLAWSQACTEVYAMAHVDAPAAPSPAVSGGLPSVQMQQIMQQQSLDFVRGVAGITDP